VIRVLAAHWDRDFPNVARDGAVSGRRCSTRPERGYDLRAADNDKSREEGTGDMAHLGRHAVVIGASMGGLLAARALADHYAEVTVLERDTLSETHEPRKGVPQGRHAHGLLARGREVLDQLFPGLSEEMVAQGAIYGDVVDDVLWLIHGVYLLNAPSALQGLLISRPMLEDGVRRRVLQLPNIRQAGAQRRDGADVRSS
jgi:2-polyprenyl-6-methoxyphenol hydroxylase-like FAD-dependent oxidoreductase